MANDSSLGAAETQAFDLETQKGVMHLLASVRASELDGERKNELRDLVFEYTNGGRDETVRRSLMQKVEAFGVIPLVVEVSEPEPEVVEQTQYDFGTSRPAPSFAPQTAKSDVSAAEQKSAAPQNAKPVEVPVDLPTVVEEPKVAAAPAPEPPKPEPVPEPVKPEPPVPTPEPPKPEPPAPTPEPVPEPPKPAPAPEPPKPEPAPEPVKPAPTPEPVPEPPKPETAPEPPAPAPEPVKPEPTPEPSKPEPVPEPPKPEPAPGGVSPEQSLQRIREIKAVVNDRVGNPVNLVDIDNEVGREYMAALLDAMKKLNNGASPSSAMQRLEDAFASVERTLDEKGDTPPPKPAPTPEPPKPEPVPEPPKPAPAPEPEPEPVKPVVPPLEVVKPPQPVPVPPPPKPQEGASMPNVPPAPQSSAAKQVKVEPPKIVPKGAPGPQSKQLTPKEVATAWGPETDTVKPTEAAKPAPQTITPKAASLAQSETKLRTPNDLPLASSIETSSVAGDPLFTRQVDDGLEQLLAEWSLFKKSGLFGTGPKGREHPLYKKIADLQIPLLLAGRFEGATQEIKQSITDYMNGWRYEQGIIYEQGETFEHYLRRVIRHILDLQEQGRKS